MGTCPALGPSAGVVGRGWVVWCVWGEEDSCGGHVCRQVYIVSSVISLVSFVQDEAVIRKVYIPEHGSDPAILRPTEVRIQKYSCTV